jgi:5'(3')-deoxyribonucleotidase
MDDDVDDGEVVALIDLDGSVANYSKAMNSKLLELASPSELEPTNYDLPYVKARRQLIKSQPGFWRNLEPIPTGFSVVNELRAAGFSLHVLSQTPLKSLNAWTEKAEWCVKHMPDVAITLTRNKALTGGRVLFDDWPPYVTRWLANHKQSYVIMLSQPWNMEFIHPRVFRVDQQRYAAQLPQLRALLNNIRQCVEPAMEQPLLNLE